MSARTYKLQLDRTLEKLSAQTLAAQEWRLVAENRCNLLVAIDAALNVQVSKLLKLGTVFGVDPADPGIPLADATVHSGDDITLMILAKVEAASNFTSHLASEAISLESSLSSTLEIALSAVAVERPSADLRVSDHSSLAEEITRSLSETFNRIENDSDHSEEEGSVHSDNSQQLVRSGHHTASTSIDSLFKS